MSQQRSINKNLVARHMALLIRHQIKTLKGRKYKHRSLSIPYKTINAVLTAAKSETLN